MDGVIVVDKPGGMTSHDVVNRMRRFANTKKIGHLGTLDPSATGVLPLVIGRATRLAQFFTRNDKEYEGVIRFGQATTTYDAEGQPVGDPADVTIYAEQLEPLLADSGAVSSRFRRQSRPRRSAAPPPTSWCGKTSPWCSSPWR